MEQKQQLIALLRYGAIGGNALFFLWILYNGINQGFQGTRIEVISYIGLMALLLLNAFLLFSGQRKAVA